MERINKDKRFKKGQITKEVYDVIIYDLESLKDCIKDKEDFDYHFNLLKGNLKDIFGITKEIEEW